MDGWRGYCLKTDGVDPIHRDGVHPNCRGQWLMVREIFRAMGYPDLRTMKIDGVVKIAREGARLRDQEEELDAGAFDVLCALPALPRLN